jgi:DNA-binding NarL/FixJ family response regulator
VPIQVAIARQGPKESCPAGWCRSKPKGFVCLGCHKSRDELLQRLPLQHADVVVLDIAIADDHVDCVQLLRRVLPKLPILVISERKEPLAILKALMSGARGYLLKPVPLSDLEDSVRCVARGEPAFSPEALSRLVGAFNQANQALPNGVPLSRRQQEVMAAGALGGWNKEISSELYVKDDTIHMHVHSLCKKLRVRNKKAALETVLGAGLSPSLNSSPRATVGAMTPKNYPKSPCELARRFATEEACCQYLFELRWPEGFRCPGCHGTQAWRTGRGLWLCGSCHGQISVTAGTIFHGTRVPLPAWFRAAWEVAGQEKGATVSGVMRLLRLGSYETAWTCVHKLRRCLDVLMSRSKHRCKN